MKKLFQKRRTQFRNQCVKYLRYVLNDHFVLVLMVFLGFLSLQYRQLILTAPKNGWLIISALLVLQVLFLFSGKIGTYLEEADEVFLLPKEREIVTEVTRAGNRLFLIWGGLQVLLQAVLYPLYLALGLATWHILLMTVLLIGLKYLHVSRTLATFKEKIGGQFQWSEAIAIEKRRKQSILRFFALFTNVKGITTSVKQRKYLNFFLSQSKKKDDTWEFLYLRAFLRAGDYLGVTGRLAGLSLLSLVAISESWLAIGITALLHYLTLFQLLGLYRHYDYQYMTQLYPANPQARSASFKKVLYKILYSLLILYLIVGLVFVADKMMVLVLLLVGIILHHLYLPNKIKKLID